MNSLCKLINKTKYKPSSCIVKTKCAKMSYFNPAMSNDTYILLYALLISTCISRLLFLFYWIENKMTKTNRQPTKKKNANSKQSNTNLQKDRGRIMFLGGVRILCWPVTPAFCRNWKKTDKVWTFFKL